MNFFWKKLKSLVLILITLLIGSSTAIGQKPKMNFVEIELKDSTVLLAELIKADEEQLEVIIIDDSLNQIQIVPLAEVKQYTRRSSRWIKFNSTPDSLKYIPKVLADRNLLGFTGYNSKKGQGYYQNILLFGHYGGYNITDRLSVEGGFEFFSLIPWNNNADSNIEKLPAFLIASKYTVLKSQNNFDINIGGFLIREPFSEDLIAGGVAYGELSYHKNRHSFSIGLGVVPKDNVIGDRPLVTASGTIQVTKQIAILASSWFYRSNGDLFVYNKIGVRCEIVGFSLDLAITRLDYGAEEESISES
ncbi:MAG: hypothetical protein AB8F74_13290, partial [Saprospiraceae bacterium]